MFKRGAIFVLGLILAINIATALDIDDYNVTFNMVDKKVVAEFNIILSEKTTETVQFSIPSDSNALSVYVDEKSIAYEVKDDKIIIDLNDNTQIRFNYVTQEFTDKNNFLMNLVILHDVKNLDLELVLPEGAALEKPIKREDLGSGSIYPRPTQASTDGRSLIFIWERSNLKPGDEIAIFAQIDPKKNYIWILISLFVLVIGASLIFYFALKIYHKPTVKEIKKEYDIEKHLKEDEEQIVTVLKLKGGGCEQGTIRIATGFSKATLSRILSELEERNVVYKEKKGKKNIVYLKK